MKIFRYLFVMPLLFSGCAAMQQTDLSSFKSELAQLQVKVNNIETRQADLYSKYESSLVNSDTQSATAQELYKKISQLSQKVQDLEVIVNKNIAKSGSNVLPPSVMYQTAYNDFLAGKYEMAVFEFNSFIKKYKEHDLAPQAQYYIGESLYAEAKWTEAYEEYKKVEALYKNSEYVPSARLKMSLCLEMLGRENDAMLILQSILLDYPKSAEVFTAKEKLKVYNSNAESDKQK